MRQILGVLISAIMLTACDGVTGSGNIITEKRSVGNFEGISTSGSIDVEVQNGAEYKVEVEADDNVLEYIITVIKNGRLDVRYKSNMSFTNVHTKVYVTGPGFEELAIRGSGSITSKSTLMQNGRMQIKITGSGDANLTVESPEITAAITGSGTIMLKGRTRSFDASITGSGDMKCRDLKSENTKVEITGSGTAHVFASVFLEARSHGSGDIFYHGNPASKEIKDGGSGSIEAN